MDMLENKPPDSTSFLGSGGRVQLDNLAFKCEVIEINLEDECGNPEVIDIYSDDETDNAHKIVEIVVPDDDVVEIQSKDTDRIDDWEISKSYLGNVDQPTSSPGLVKVQNVIGEKEEVDREESSTKTIMTFSDCYIDLHKNIDQSNMSNCKKCKKSGTTVSSFQDSIKPQMPIVKSETNLSNNNVRLQCSLCHNYYSSKLYLKYHACAADKGDDNDFDLNNFRRQQRPNNETVNQDKYKLQRKQGNNQPHVCLQCKKTFRLLIQLNQHLRVHHKTNQYECDECGDKFTELYHLESHKSIKHVKTMKINDTKCKYCSLDVRALVKHYREFHPNERPYPCAECGKSFKKKSYLRVHLGLHTGKKPYVCKKCGKAFRLKFDFNNHQSSKTACKKHMIRDSLSKLPHFVCDQCGKIFKARRNLRQHLQTHSDVRRFVCKKCGKPFRRKCNLHSHMRRIHKKKKACN